MTFPTFPTVNAVAYSAYGKLSTDSTEIVDKNNVRKDYVFHKKEVRFA